MKYLKTIGIKSNQPVGRGFLFPYDVSFASDGKIFAINRSRVKQGWSSIHILTFDEEWLGDFGRGQLISDDDYHFELPVAIAFDSKDLLYLTDEGSNEIKIFDAEGKFVDRWGSDGFDGAGFDGPSGIAIDTEDCLYVVERNNNRVHKISPDGRSMFKWGEFGTSDGQFNMPWGISLDFDNNVFVADWRNDRIQKFTSDGEFISAFGKSGYGEGEFNRPSSVVVDSNGNIIVADWGNERIQILNPDGSFKMFLQGEATLSKWALEWLNVNIDEYDARKKSDLYIKQLPPHLRTPYHVGSQTEHLFYGPVSVKLDSEERLYITEHSRARVQVYEQS